MALLSRLGTVSVPFLACLALSQGVAAQSDTALISAADPEKIFEIAKTFGNASLDKDDFGNPMIIGRMNETKYGLYFYGCRGGQNCTSIEFNAAWSGSRRATLDRINAWHRISRYGKAFLNGDTPVLQMSVNLDRGVTRKNLEDTFDWWGHIIPEFRRNVVE
ncbi:MAG: YbjN domain-containing protein [Leptothrix ochracea]|uniref:YbjN domain-containing protein n=1 Tax=Leptothrix ochracea TaxID=735331 RepID=UPI0034E26283